MRLFYAALIVVLYFLLCFVCYRRYRRSHPVSTPPKTATDNDWLVAYASQGGFALSLAQQSADQLRAGNVAVTVLPLNQVSEVLLKQYSQMLIVASTFGEGEAPDNGNRFLARIRSLELPHLQYGLLALGDRDYRFYCGFAHALHHALHKCGASPLLDMVEVDKGDPAALRHWQYYLGQISGQVLFPDWKVPEYDAWQLVSRLCLNPKSPGAPAFYLQLKPQHSNIVLGQWEAGDIAEIGPCNSDKRIKDFCETLHRHKADASWFDENFKATLKRKNLPQDESVCIVLAQKSSRADVVNALKELPHREYSIASIPENGVLELVVRQVKHDAQDFGLGSGWLTHFASLHDAIFLRIRCNPVFHAPTPSVPMILIGNGTGIAGLRSHLLNRRKQGASNNWLLFGERTAAHDFFFQKDLTAWLTEGSLKHLDVVFSRDALVGEPRYVQDLLPLHAERLKIWVDEGAAIYVCGSLQGMAGGVDEQLARILGRDTLDELADTGRYCRDVY